MVEQEIDAMLLRLDRVIGWTHPDDFETLHSQLIAAPGTWLGSHLSRECDGRLGGEPRKAIPRFRRELRLDENGLHRAEAVACDDKCDLARRAKMRDPPTHGDDGADVVPEVGNSNGR